MRQELHSAEQQGLSLTATQCRRLLGKVLATAQFSDPEQFCQPDFPIPPDEYSRMRLRAWPADRRRYSVVDLIRLLRGKRVSFVGDSLTGQVTNALECSLKRAGQALESTSVRLTLPGLRAHCDALWDAVIEGANVSSCSCRVTELKSWQDSACRLFARAPAFEARRGRASSAFGISGTRATRNNVTWFKRFGDVYQYVRECPTCGPRVAVPATGARASAAAIGGIRASRPRTQASGLRTALAKPHCEQHDFCAARPLPRHVEIVRQTNLADVIILNFGLWCA